jgi:hypothetical protein
MYVIVVSDGRKPPTGAIPTDAEKIELFNGMGAYAGAYTFDFCYDGDLNTEPLISRS